MPELKKIGILSLNLKKIDQLALTLEYNSKIAVEELIFHNMINSNVNLKRKLIQIS